MTPMEEYLQFLSLQGAQPGSSSYAQGKQLAETLGGNTPQYTGAKDYAPFEQFLAQQFGNIRDPNATPETREEFNIRASNAEDGGMRYEPNTLQVPAHLRYNPSMGFGGVSDRNNPIGVNSLTPTGFSQTTAPNEYGGMEPTAGAPTGYTAALTTPYERDGVRGQYEVAYDASGKMVGSPKWRAVPHEHESLWKSALKGAALVGGAAFGLPALGNFIGGLGAAGGVTAASLGELGLNTALAAGTPGGIASGLSAASLGELGINTALAAGSEGGIAAGTALSGAEAAPSFFESLNLGKTAFPNAPSYVQQGVNRFGTGLITSGGDPEAAAKSALMGGLSDFGNIALADLPPEVRQLVTTGARTALQGGDLESVLKSAAFGTLSGNVTQAITGATGSKWAGELASNAIKQALTSGNIDPRNLTASTLAQLAGRAVGAETGNEYLGRAATTAVLGAIKGKDLEDIAKQMAMGALNTPTKKG